MTNIKLHVLCLFALTICTVMNDIECTMRKECRKMIYNNNSLILKLNDAQKLKLLELITIGQENDNLTAAFEDSKEYKMITFFVNEHRFAGLGDFIFPPDNKLLKGLDENDTIYCDIYENEERFQKILIKHVLGIELTDDISGQLENMKLNLDSPCSYDTVVKLRRYHLNEMFRHFLDVNSRQIPMCQNGETMKCVLVGLIKRTFNYDMRNTAQCDNFGTCTITLAEWVLDPKAKFDNLPQVKEFYQDDLYDRDQGFYHTLLVNPKERNSIKVELIGWPYSIPRVQEKGPSNEE